MKCLKCSLLILYSQPQLSSHPLCSAFWYYSYCNWFLLFFAFAEILLKLVLTISLLTNTCFLSFYSSFCIHLKEASFSRIPFFKLKHCFLFKYCFKKSIHFDFEQIPHESIFPSQILFNDWNTLLMPSSFWP